MLAMNAAPSPKAARRAAAAARAARKAAELGPTPETARQLRPDVVLDMQARGWMDGDARHYLSQDEVNAAGEISEMWRALITLKLHRRAYGLSAGGASGTASDPISGMSDSDARLWSSTWRPWADEFGALTLRGQGRRVTALEVVIDVVHDGLDPGPGGKTLVRAALERWAEIRTGGRRGRR